MNTEQMNLVILIILVNLVILVSLVILVNLAILVRSGCGHHCPNILYTLASMLKIYILPLNAHVTMRDGRQTIEDRGTQRLHYIAG